MDTRAPGSRPPFHEFALELERARREAGLRPKELASQLFVHPRTVRRYLNGERLPTIQTTEAWERACSVEAGRLRRIHPGMARHGQDMVAERRSASPPGEAETSEARPSERRRWLLPAVAGIAVFAVLGLGALVLTRGNDKIDPAQTPQDHPTRAADHRFTASYVGDVWIRITPARAHVGESHRVRFRWGPLMQDVDLHKLDRPRVLLTGKNRPDYVTLLVNVKPAATISFGEGNVPGGALDIKPGWTKAK